MAELLERLVGLVVTARSERPFLEGAVAVAGPVPTRHPEGMVVLVDFPVVAAVVAVAGAPKAGMVALVQPAPAT